MAKQDEHGIAWTDETWNPLRGCSPHMKCAPNCWAARMARRQAGMSGYTGFVDERGHWTGKVALIESQLDAPLHMRTPRRIAVGLMGDWMRLLDEDVHRILGVEALCPQHQFLHLTKCAEQMRSLFWRHIKIPTEDAASVISGKRVILTSRWPMSHILLGVSILDQHDADAAREPMRELAAAGWRTWVSHEPAWGGIDWAGWEFLKYMVSGGESGPKARPSHPDWFRADRDFCAAHGIAWMFKQWGEWAPYRPVSTEGYHYYDFDKGREQSWRVGKRAAGRLLDGREHLALPEATR